MQVNSRIDVHTLQNLKIVYSNPKTKSYSNILNNLFENLYLTCFENSFFSYSKNFMCLFNGANGEIISMLTYTVDKNDIYIWNVCSNSNYKGGCKKLIKAFTTKFNAGKLYNSFYKRLSPEYYNLYLWVRTDEKDVNIPAIVCYLSTNFVFVDNNYSTYKKLRGMSERDISNFLQGNTDRVLKFQNELEHSLMIYKKSLKESYMFNSKSLKKSIRKSRRLQRKKLKRSR